ncbi:MAG: DUF5667 domain-containing protein, partial [Dehalococcoidia bacterium]
MAGSSDTAGSAEQPNGESTVRTMRFWEWPSSAERDFEAVLAACLEEADSREAIQDCLSRYPQYASTLDPLLHSSLSLRRAMAVPIREQQRLAARRRFLQAATRQAQAGPSYVQRRTAVHARTPAVLLRPLWSTFAPAIVAAVFFVVALGPIMALTSSSALPGDWNYGFKRSSERVRLALTLNPSDRLNLQLAFHERRLGEIERLASEGRLTDPTLVTSFTSETKALVNSVSDNPALGPSEALKVAQVTEAQALTLADKVEPNVGAPVQSAVAVAVNQSQQAQEKARSVAQVKEQEQALRPSRAAAGTTTATMPLAKKTASPQASHTPTAAATSTAVAGAGSSPSPAASSIASPSPAASAVASPSPAATAEASAASPAASPAGSPGEVAASPTPGRLLPVAAALTATAAGSTVPARPSVATPILVPAAPSTPAPTPAAIISAPVTLPVVPPIQPPSRLPIASEPASPIPARPATPLPTPSPHATPAPSPTPIATLVATPKPSPSPAVLIPPPQPPPSTTRFSVTLAPGQETSLPYLGPKLPITEALASIDGHYAAIFYTVPSEGGTTVHEWYPGIPGPVPVLERGAKLTIL